MRVRRVVTIPILVAAIGLATASSAGAAGGTATYSVTLSGAQAVCPIAPGTCGGPGTGTATVGIYVRPGAVCYYIQTQNVAVPLTSARIHRGATGVVGPAVVPLFVGAVNTPTVGLPDGTTCTEGVASGLLRDINKKPQNYYVQVNNVPFPNGALRGQLR